MLNIRELSADAIRDAINVTDRFESLIAAQQQLEHSYSGSMLFVKRGTTEYLLRRTGPAKARTEKTMGRRSPETEQRLTEFNDKREALKVKIAGIKGVIEGRRRLLIGRGLGRMPVDTANILRRLDATRWLGARLHVIGTSALYAYEAAVGIRIDAGDLATDDIDILNDSRQAVSLFGDVSANGFIGVLRGADKSFAPIAGFPYRAENSHGFIVDLIGPHGYDPTRTTEVQAIKIRAAQRLSDHPDELQPVGIDGLEWLVNAPKFSAVTFDTRGVPLRIPTVDPRVFAAHKVWLSTRPDRRLLKQARDRKQAVIAAVIAEAYLGMTFDDPVLSAVPRELIEGVESIRPEINKAIADLPKADF